MDFLRTKAEDHIYHVMLDRGKSNAMDVTMVNELIEAIDTAEKDLAIEGLILSGKEGFFSSGLDLIALYEYDEVQMKEFWTRFMLLLQKLVAFPKPVVSAITGHSPAGGCVLTLCCDYRIMAEGEYVIGLNEIPVGIVVPEAIFKLYAFWLGQGMAYRSLMEGKLFSPQEALKIGLVDEIVSLARIQNTVWQKIRNFTQFEKNAWQQTKRNFREELVVSLTKNTESAIEQVLAQWWRPSTRAVLKTIIGNLTQRKG
ncbi:MAG TPA: enoyl-CoA hydratase/isomerase family protein [Sphingobacterium sp.]|nr:enoyl-CoA hydratase/isomerase family protein [Sphingobacterium sp.]